MDDFAIESSIGGVVVFHNSESKKSRIAWLFVYFLFFILIGFYVSFIYTRCKFEPEFSYKFSEFPLQEIPFPAVTICNPLFARNQSVNLQEFLKNPTENLTAEQQNLIAANVQVCAPELGSKIDKFCPLADTRKIVEVLKSEYSSTDDAFAKTSKSGAGCTYNWRYTKCSKIVNRVLTDFGFCFTFNLEGFSTLFNTKIVSDDFKCFSRDGKIVKNYYFGHPDHNLIINEANQSIDWNLEKGFLTNSIETLPVRALFKKSFEFQSILNSTDCSNLCPKIQNRVSFFLHMPNEILTPFHQSMAIKGKFTYLLKAKVIKVDESLRPFPPHKRNCFFEGERKLKFFKSYTKAHCEFECLANFTLAQCGCVKFSMPRESTTRICGLNDTSCYIQMYKNWNLTCNCLHPCTYIEYKVDKELIPSLNKLTSSTFKATIFFEALFGEKIEILGNYEIYSGFADFGGMLGTLFGASLISFIEIFYFLILSLIKKRFQILKRREDVQVSEFSSSSTIHGIQFIFDKSRHKLIRLFWILVFSFTFSCCIYNSRESYWKLNVKPETESSTNLKPIEEIPFPSITICTPFFAKENLTVEPFLYLSNFDKNYSVIQELSSDRFHYLIANNYWMSPNLLFNYIKARKMYVENITDDPENHRTEVDLFPYLFQSHLEVDELFFNCKFQGEPLQCSKLFKKVMTIRRICYASNLQSHRQIFNEEISKNFDSYSKSDENQEAQWSLDQGYFSNSTNPYPTRATANDVLELNLKLSLNVSKLAIQRFFLSLPNEILTHVSSWNSFRFNTQNIVKLSAKSKRIDQGLRKFKPHFRGCYFQDERKLKFFSSYTRSNCMLECFTNITLKSCSCVPFLLPHNNLTRLCDSANEAKCYSFNVKHFPPLNDSLNPCSCLPTCNDIEYSLEEQQEEELKEKFQNFSVSNLRFQFSSSKVLEEEIRIGFGIRDFLTNVGGLLGLYLGCSVISVLEVFYFLFAFLHGKLSRVKNQIVPTNKGNDFSYEENLGQKCGLTLREIFDLEEF